MEDPDGRLLGTLNNKQDVFRSILQEDRFDDWHLAKDFGEFLIRIEPQEAIGHAVLARAFRHLGNNDHAREELEQCQLLVRHPYDADLLLPFLSDENRFLSRGGKPGDGNPGGE